MWWVLTVDMRVHFTEHPNIGSNPKFAANMLTFRFIEMHFKLNGRMSIALQERKKT